MTWKSV